MEYTQKEESQKQEAPVISGFGCAWCWEPLEVGVCDCPKCLRPFATPTPPLRSVHASHHPFKMQGLSQIYKDRMILPEIEALRKQGRLPFVEREAQAEKQRRMREERAKHPAPTQDMSKFVMGKASDFALSGTFCPKCRIPLLVGCTQCVRCRLVFRKPVALGTRRKSEEWLRTPESY